MPKMKMEVRIEPDLHAQIKTRAQASGRSINQWVLDALGFALSGTKAVEVTTSTMTTETVRRTL